MNVFWDSYLKATRGKSRKKAIHISFVQLFGSLKSLFTFANSLFAIIKSLFTFIKRLFAIIKRLHMKENSLFFCETVHKKIAKIHKRLSVRQIVKSFISAVFLMGESFVEF